uniref:Uncharacterized protein n=1 Tax=Desulfacinum infernum TaxID=35837 RepID=A0A832A7B7_9BACT
MPFYLAVKHSAELNMLEFLPIQGFAAPVIESKAKATGTRLVFGGTTKPQTLLITKRRDGRRWLRAPPDEAPPLPDEGLERGDAPLGRLVSSTQERRRDKVDPVVSLTSMASHGFLLLKSLPFITFCSQFGALRKGL